MQRSSSARGPQLLSLCSRARALQQEKPPQGEACAPQLESSPHSLKLEKNLRSKEDLAQPKH